MLVAASRPLLKRVCLDFAFGDVWYRHLKKPAQKYLEGRPLARALQCALDLAEGDACLLELRNEQSLAWRGKRIAAGDRSEADRLKQGTRH